MDQNDNKKNRQNFGRPSKHNNPNREFDYRNNHNLGRNDKNNNPSNKQTGMGGSDNNRQN